MNSHRNLDDRMKRAAARWVLTPRQTEVLQLLVAGYANKEIADELGCASSTVEVHVTQILRKAAVGGRSLLTARFWSEDDA